MFDRARWGGSILQGKGGTLLIEEGLRRTLRFGTKQIGSFGKANFTIPYANEKQISLNLVHVNINVPILLGLDVVDAYKLYVINIKDLIIFVEPQSFCTLTRRLSHLYYNRYQNVYG